MYTVNEINPMDGMDLLRLIPKSTIPVCFFDPQYRGLLKKQKYGSSNRMQIGLSLPQMDDSTITEFIQEIDRKLIASGHLFLWSDKFNLCQGTYRSWCKDTDLEIVDMVTWEKNRIGMGYRTRRKSEYCIVLQKKPKRAKGCWKLRNIPDVWNEGVDTNGHPHAKPIQLQAKLIEATTEVGDIVLDPCCGSGSVLTAAKSINRTFVGSDLQLIGVNNGKENNK